MGFYLWLTLILGIVILIIVYCSEDCDELKELKATGTTLVVFSLIGLAIYVFNPTAMDVYRGKTELEITSINGVPKDSTVVFK